MRFILEDGDSSKRAASAREGSLATAKTVISSFNCIDRSMATLTNTDSKTVLTVGGKPDALIVSWQNDHNRPPYITLCADRPMGGRITLMVGQLADFESEVVVTPSEANDAIEHVIKTGQMTPHHRWREE